MREDLLKGLTEEQKNKVKECKSSEEILALAYLLPLPVPTSVVRIKDL